MRLEVSWHSTERERGVEGADSAETRNSKQRAKASATACPHKLRRREEAKESEPREQPREKAMGGTRPPAVVIGRAII